MSETTKAIAEQALRDNPRLAAAVARESDPILERVRRIQARREAAGNAVWFRRTDGRVDMYAKPNLAAAIRFRFTLERLGYEILPDPPLGTVTALNGITALARESVG